MRARRLGSVARFAFIEGDDDRRVARPIARGPDRADRSFEKVVEIPRQAGGILASERTMSIVALVWNDEREIRRLAGEIRRQRLERLQFFEARRVLRDPVEIGEGIVLLRVERGGRRRRRLRQVARGRKRLRVKSEGQSRRLQLIDEAIAFEMMTRLQWRRVGGETTWSVVPATNDTM